MIRFGDGEVQLLEADPDDADSMRVAIRKLKRQAAGSFASEDVLDVKANVSLAFDEADVLGILPDDNFSEKWKMWMARLAAHYAERRAKGRPAEALACCLLNHDIVDALPEMLAGRRVSAISCRDIKPVLEAEWGLDNVAVYQVPSQHAVRDVDGPYEAALHGVPMWPDAHAHLQADLTVRARGEVFLVGAGVFGKDLCIRIRERGGIALDMGSALDRIAGKITRGPKRRALELRAGGMSVEEIAADFRRTYGVSVDHDRIAKIVDKPLDAR